MKFYLAFFSSLSFARLFLLVLWFSHLHRSNLITLKPLCLNRICQGGLNWKENHCYRQKRACGEVCWYWLCIERWIKINHRFIFAIITKFCERLAAIYMHLWLIISSHINRETIPHRSNSRPNYLQERIFFPPFFKQLKEAPQPVIIIKHTFPHSVRSAIE